MIKRTIATVAVASVVLAGVAAAVPAPKYFVCKYVGKPGVDERLQTGNNPISVSGNALEQPVVVGAYFNDAQGRSLVVAEDTGQAEPECPLPVNTNPPKEEPPVVVTPPTTDTSSTPTASTPAEVPGNVESLPENK